jgi:hypothetical protein
MGLIDKTQYEYYNNSSGHGDYQFVSMEEIINNFMIAYVGEDKIISKIKRLDVAFHAQRALAELSFDTFKATKSQEIEVPASLSMTLPHDYVNYTNIAWVDSSGIEHTIYPATKTSNPKAITQDTDGNYTFGSGNLLANGDFSVDAGFYKSATVSYNNTDKDIDFSGATKWDAIWWKELPIITGESYTLTYTISSYTAGKIEPRLYASDGSYISFTIRSSAGTFTETLEMTSDSVHATGKNSFHLYSVNSNENATLTIDNVSLTASSLSYQSESNSWESYKSTTPSENLNQDYNYDHDDYDLNVGQRFGLDPRFSQTNGSFYIDEENGKIHFSSNISGKTIVLKYISDGLATDEEMRIHKFAEDAMYKCILCNIMDTRRGVGPGLKMQYKREKFAATRVAKLRLSNIKIEELAQLLRGRSKHIKH